jgi:hypothetical protein
LLRSILVIQLLFLSGEQLHRFDAGLLRLLLLERILNIALLAMRFDLLLMAELKILQALRNVLFQCCLLEARSV